MFEAVANELNVKLTEIVHIGDRELKDIEGPHAVGARAVLCTVVKNRCTDNTSADAICSNFLDLLTILQKLNLLFLQNTYHVKGQILSLLLYKQASKEQNISLIPH